MNEATRRARVIEVQRRRARGEVRPWEAVHFVGLMSERRSKEEHRRFHIAAARILKRQRRKQKPSQKEGDVDR